MLPTQATVTTAISFLFNTCQVQKQSVKRYSYPVSHKDIQRATGIASHVLTVTLDGHTHKGQWVGPTNGQGALNKKNVAYPLMEIKPPIVLTTSNHYTYNDDCCERDNELLGSTKELVKQDSATGS